MNHQRRPAGAPTGGQFAASVHAEADSSLTPPAATAWDQLDEQFDGHLQEHLEGLWEPPSGPVWDRREGYSESREDGALDIMGLTYDEAVAAYGAERADWLSKVAVAVHPAEGDPDGNIPPRTQLLFYPDRDGNPYERVVHQDDIDFSGDDGLGDPVPITRYCPVGRDGSDVPVEWRNVGFHDADTARSWADAGYPPAAAMHWHHAGFTPDEVRQYRPGELNQAIADRQRRPTEAQAR